MDKTVSACESKVASPLPMKALFSIALVVILVQNFLSIASAISGHYFLAYPDAYMRLVKVMQLLTHHHWFDHLISTTNSPYGADFHCWTRALDVLLAMGALVLSIFMPLKKALWVWSFILPPTFKLLSALLMVWAFKPIEESFWQRLFIVVAFLFHPYIQTTYLPLRVDYNFLTITLFIAYVGIYLRLLKKPSQQGGILLGVVFALGSWVSLSFFIAGFIPVAYLLFIWVIQPKHPSAHLSGFFVSALIGVFFVILIEHGRILVYNFDVLSFYYWLLLGLVALSYFLCNSLTTKTYFRLVLFVIIVISGLALLFYHQKELIYGPYAAADPFWRSSVFPLLIEHISPFKVDKVVFFSLMINFVFGALAFILRKRMSNCPCELSGLVWMTFPLVVFSVLMLRWNDYSQPVFIFAAAQLIIVIQQRVLTVWKIREKGREELTMAVLSLLLAFAPFMIHRLIPHRIQTEMQICLHKMMGFIASNEFKNLEGGRSLRLVVEPGVAPAVLFYTQHEVLAGFYHTNLMGMKDTLGFIQGPSSVAKQIANRRQLDGALLCKRSLPPKNSVLGELAKGERPSFLKPFQNAEPHQNFYFYQILKP